jgi:hypothetical protein
MMMMMKMTMMMMMTTMMMINFGYDIVVVMCFWLWRAPTFVNYGQAARAARASCKNTNRL